MLKEMSKGNIPDGWMQLRRKYQILLQCIVRLLDTLRSLDWLLAIREEQITDAKFRRNKRFLQLHVN